MAEKPEKRAEEKAAAPAAKEAAPPAAESKKPSGGLFKSTPFLLGIVMILEAVILFAGFKFFGGGPVSAQGAQLATGEETHGSADAHGSAPPKAESKKAVEVKVLEFKAQNKQSGRTYVFDVAVYALAKGPDKAALEGLISDRDAMIKDRVRTIIAQSDPEKLAGAEPGLETFRRQVKHQLEEILGEGLIEEILVPRCIPYRADY